LPSMNLTSRARLLGRRVSKKRNLRKGRKKKVGKNGRRREARKKQRWNLSPASTRPAPGYKREESGKGNGSITGETPCTRQLRPGTLNPFGGGSALQGGAKTGIE